MIQKDNRFEVIKPSFHAKYKKLCKSIYNGSHKKFIQVKDSKPFINIPTLMEILITKLKPTVKVQYIRYKKYEEIDFINGIVEIISNCSYWNRYKVPGKYLNKRHNEYTKWGVYECLYRIVLRAYFNTTKFHKLQYQCIDSTFVPNLFGKDVYGRNPQYKSKNGVKISAITDRNGVPISLAIGAGNRHDSLILDKHVNHELIDTESKRVSKNNKYKQFVLGDAGYFSENLKRKFDKQQKILLTDVNNKNTKDKAKLKILIKQKRKYQNPAVRVKQKETISD